MKTINLHNKKVGIWGLGIVGKSVVEYAKKFTDQIQIMDRNQHTNVVIIPENPENIINFLQHNEIIIASPGIMLHNYKHYAHKFINELDIFAQEFSGTTIAITGTVGKTTITSLLQQCIPDSVAAGNIGYAMLNILSMQPIPKKVVLELSSYQLAASNNFTPEIAIWTNFYPNHLDHHKDEQEYFLAKCNLLKNQRADQIALLPYNIINKILNCITPQAQIFLFNETKIKTAYPLFFVNNHQVILQQNNQQQIIFDQFDQLCDITFAQNWLIIIATLYLQKIPLHNLAALSATLKPQPHRVEFVRNFNGVKIYNDSKSTVWQATKLAVDRFKDQRIALFLGGLSKGTDRTPLMEYIAKKNITVFAFGKEADLLVKLCKQFNIKHFCALTMQEAVNRYLEHQINFDILLFSPAGASFDLFKNFEDRGSQFKALICSL